MDFTTESGVVARLREYLRGRTHVLATHTLPLLQLVDRVIVLDGGKVVTEGPRDRVMEALTRPLEPAASRAREGEA